MALIAKQSLKLDIIIENVNIVTGPYNNCRFSHPTLFILYIASSLRHPQTASMYVLMSLVFFCQQETNWIPAPPMLLLFSDSILGWPYRSKLLPFALLTVSSWAFVATFVGHTLKLRNSTTSSKRILLKTSQYFCFMLFPPRLPWLSIIQNHTFYNPPLPTA